ncbi:class I SAM-dependent methyltransferase [Streptomyces roseirectus]|uniref:Class I SAM-dependent methyltransferase n=1 Tax=Streptomyces roseirectus TaxID=2768066 RepID=A0A7H0IJN6_9ACTN|nr:class I SAM-dependent methyltransferase [Streptomyces roseirectus]QNP73002.1 class I SAM-dependent methyltransferase [Streptomyces roseirectus]
MDRNIRTVDDVLDLLDSLFTADADRWSDGAGGDWWDRFYADRSRSVPFFVDKPDENLADLVERGVLTGGRALELGCGPGRNARYLAAHGYEVDAVDISPAAVRWAGERAREAGVDVRFHLGDAFKLVGTELTGSYDLVYDSGCFHHLPPHRRVSYLGLLDRALAPGGYFGLNCFAVGGMGSELPDADFYREGGLQGGLAYTDASLRTIFAGLTEVQLRRMRKLGEGASCFGEDFLWTALFRRGGA